MQFEEDIREAVFGGYFGGSFKRVFWGSFWRSVLGAPNSEKTEFAALINCFSKFCPIQNALNARKQKHAIF